MTLFKYEFLLLACVTPLAACGSGSTTLQMNARAAETSATDMQTVGSAHWTHSPRVDAIVVVPKHVILDLPGRTVVQVSGPGAKINSDGCSGLVANVIAKPRKSSPGEQTYAVRAIALGKCKVFFAGDDSAFGVLTVKVK